MLITPSSIFPVCASSSRPFRRRHRRTGDDGFVLVVVLLLLLAIAILGISASSNTSLQTKMARADRDYQMAFSSAESALADAEREIMRSNTYRVSPLGDIAPKIFDDQSNTAFKSVGVGCDAAGTLPTSYGSGVGLGLYDFTYCQNWWQTFSFSTANSVPIGGMTNYVFPMKSTAFGYGASALPRYVIDIVPDIAIGADSDPSKARFAFRVTSRAVGATDDTEVVLQTVVRNR